MLIKAILYPVAVFLLIGAGLLAWLSGAGLLILAGLFLLIVGAVLRDLLAGRRAAAATRDLPLEEREEGRNLEAHGVDMTRIEDQRPSRRIWGERWDDRPDRLP